MSAITNTDPYDTKYDTLKNNFVLISTDTIHGSKTLSASSSCLLSCDNIDEYYFDTILYMYIYGAIYDALDKIVTDGATSASFSLVEHKKKINNMIIRFVNTPAANLAATTKYVTKQDNANDYTFIFDFARFATSWKTTGTSATDIYFNSIDNKIPVDNLAIFGSGASGITNFNNAGFTKYTTSAASGDTSVFNYVSGLTYITTNLITTSFSKSTIEGNAEIRGIINDVTNSATYDNKARHKKIFKILYHILSLPYDKLLAELRKEYYKYGIYAYNLTFQITLRRNYLQRNKLFTYTQSVSLTTETINNALSTNTETHDGTNAYEYYPDIKIIYDKIVALNTDLTTIINYLMNDKTKNTLDAYKESSTDAENERILTMEDYKKSQDNLNRVIKIYNDYIKTYQSLKFYAKIFIIILIILIIGIIILSVLPNISADTKNISYIIGIITTIVIIYIYYDKFKYVNYQEHFASKLITYDQLTVAAGAEGAASTKVNYQGHRYDYAMSGSSCLISSTTHTADFEVLHAKVVTVLFPYINQFITLYKKVELLILSLYEIAGESAFRISGDNFIKKTIISQKETTKANKLKYVTLLELIQVMKNEINYLFNLILLIMLFILILLIGLLIYSTIPQLFILNIVICLILIISICTYFIIAIVQPTRRDSVKNYLANYRPSKDTISRL